MKIFVKVKTKSSKEKIEKVSDTNFNVWVHEIPEKGKANRAVIKTLADYFGISQANIKIVSGATAKLKVIELLK
ncbi:MAG: DUF167 domain-containing protein [Candidatus Pacebacteria bacterium]|nr:DUF167 domain-containing protein [Candidatus Paceibacterota bacterium]